MRQKETEEDEGRKGREGKRRLEKGTRQPINSSTLVEVVREKAGVDLQ